MKPWLRKAPSAVRGTVLYYAKGLYVFFRDDHIFLYAAALAFNALLCLVPILLLLAALLGMILTSSELALVKLDEILNSAFPAQPYAQQIKTAIRDFIYNLIESRSSAGYYGMAVLIWTASSLLSAVKTILRHFFQIKSTDLLPVDIAMNLFYIVVLGVLFAIANFFSWMLLPLETLLYKIPLPRILDIDVIMRSFLLIFSYLPAFLMFFIVYRFVAGRGIGVKAALLGAWTTTFLWWLAGVVFGWYLSTFHSYSSLYGTYTFLVVLIVWIYYSSFVFVIGAMMCQLYRHRHYGAKLVV